jgi:alkylation response protein AidB-like acyl-CoA dehydrogenase
MEVLTMFGSHEQKDMWLRPLLDGTIRSAFAMTEPGVASSDATNIAMRIERDGDDYVLNGRKWWITGAMHPNCKIFIVMGKTDLSAPPHRQQSQILVPMGTPGLTVVRNLPVFGYNDPEGHAELRFDDCVPPTTSSPTTATASPSARRGWGLAASTTACDRSVPPNARSNCSASGRSAARRSASDSPSAPTSWTGSPSRGSTSRWCDC